MQTVDYLIIDEAHERGDGARAREELKVERHERGGVGSKVGGGEAAKEQVERAARRQRAAERSARRFGRCGGAAERGDGLLDDVREEEGWQRAAVALQVDERLDGAGVPAGRGPGGDVSRACHQARRSAA